MTPDESVAYVKQFADAAGEKIGGDWKSLDDSSKPFTPENPINPGNYGGCALPDGKKGTNYGLLWGGSSVPADPEGAITEVQAAWEKLGVKAVIIKPFEKPGAGNMYHLSYPGFLEGTDPDGFNMELVFNMGGSRSSSFGANTHCVPIPQSFIEKYGEPR